MKKTIQLAIVLMAMIPSICFAQAKKPVWAEMKAFHYFMSTSFHPAEEGNFKPLKAKADSLFMAAENWQAAAIPTSFKTKETKAALLQLVKDCLDIKKSVEANLSDKELLVMISKAHDTFHTLAGECRKADD